MWAPTIRSPAADSGRLPDPEGDQAAVADDVVAGAGLGVPGVGLGELGEARRPRSRRASSATAWPGEGEASTKARRSSPRTS